MVLRDFDEVDVQPSPTTTQTVITESVTITQTPSEGRSWLLMEDRFWGWEELRDFVVYEIERRFGTFPRNFRTEHSIFKSFSARWGAQAGPIAKFAFGVREGYWAGAPISVNRFCKNSDPFFSSEIIKLLSQ